MRPLGYTMFINNNRTSFRLWRKENFLKHQEVSKYYENGCNYALEILDQCGKRAKIKIEANYCVYRNHREKAGRVAF